MSRGQHTEEEKLKIKESRKATSLRRKSQVVKCYELKIVEKRLNRRQHKELDMLFIEGKRLYNFILSEKKKNEVTLNCIVPTDYKEVICLDKDKKEVIYPLEYLPSHYKQTIHGRMISNEKTIRALVKKGLQKHGSLKFKSELNCIPLKNMDWKFKSANKVWIMGIKGKILVRGTKQFPDNCEFANANLLKKPNGYYLKITTYINNEDIEETKTNGKEIGLDFGIKNNITTSEGEKLNISVRESDRLKKLQRELHRRVKGSKNRNKTIKLIRKAYQRQTNIKTDQANKIVSKLKKYETIVMQDEQIANWHQEDGMSKVVQHSCMGLIKSKLKQLPQTIVLDKWIPTTKWCPKCGRLHDMSTDVRTYVCECGYHEDRDVHSANNMIAIKDLVLQTISVPMERRELTLTDWNNTVLGRSEKITPFKV